jgi:hypothetical protein
MLPEFEDLRLSNDGAHLTDKATVGLLNFLMEGNAEAPPDHPDGVSRDERLANLENETTATRQLYLDLAEQLRSFTETAASMSCRQAELIDSQINRSNENLLEIRGESYEFVTLFCILVHVVVHNFKFLHFISVLDIHVLFFVTFLIAILIVRC